MFHFHHTKYSHQEQPRFQPSNWFILFNALQLFSTVTQYMSVSHGYSTMGGIEYDGGGCAEKTKREKVSHQLGKLMGYGDAHQLLSMQSLLTHIDFY